MQMDIETLLAADNISATPVPRSAFFRIERLWVETFARGVKARTGKWVYNEIKWHGFSYGYESAIAGEKALLLYLQQKPSAFYVFDERGTVCHRCIAERLSNPSNVLEDLYIAHCDMEWTFVHTHEEPETGPFFARREGQQET